MPELILSIIAVIISAMVAVYTYLQGRKSNQLQERIVQLEEQREQDKQVAANQADVKAEIVQKPTNHGKLSKKFRIYNSGESQARNIRVWIDDEPVYDVGFIHIDEPFIEILAPGSHVDFITSFSNDTPLNWKTTILWDDDSGKDRKFETMLSQ